MDRGCFREQELDTIKESDSVSREANLESWIFIVAGKFYGINFTYHYLCDWGFCFTIHKTVGML